MWNQISEPIELALNKPLPTMWDSMLKAFCDVSDKASDVYLKRPKVRNDREHIGMCTSHIMSVGFNCMDEENADSLNVLQRQGWSALWLKVEEQTSDPNILSKLRSTRLVREESKEPTILTICTVNKYTFPCHLSCFDHLCKVI